MEEMRFCQIIKKNKKSKTNTNSAFLMKFLTKFRDPFTIFILVYNQVGLGGGGKSCQNYQKYNKYTVCCCCCYFSICFILNGQDKSELL